MTNNALDEGDDDAGVASTSGTGWSEPPWSGWIETTGDALLILEAARRGLIPRVTRRLVDSERKMITSGSVFVFDEDESGIKRWTDGFLWSPSRILGNFLIYRETNKRPPIRGKPPPPPQDLPDDAQDEPASPSQEQNQSQAHSVGAEAAIQDKQRERMLLGSLINSTKFKPDGMIKKTFSLTIGGVSQHLISYYKVADVENGRLRAPSSLPELASLEISPEYLDKTHFRIAPKVEIGPDGIPRYRGEAEEPDPTSLKPQGEGTSTNERKKSKRYEPYANGTLKKPKKSRVRKQDSTSSTARPSSTDASNVGTSASYPDAYGSYHYYPYAYSTPTTGEASTYSALPYYWPPAYGSTSQHAAGHGDRDDEEEGDVDEDGDEASHYPVDEDGEKDDG